MDVLSIVLLVVGLVVLVLGILKVTKGSQIVALIGVVLLVFGGLGAWGVIDYTKLTGSTQTNQQNQNQQSFTGVYQTPAQQPQPASPSCAAQAITSNGKSQADVLYQNIENGTGLGFLPASLSANFGGDGVTSFGTLIDSATANAGGAGTAYVSMSNIPNCGTGNLLAVVSSGAGQASSRQLVDAEKGQAVSGYNFADKAVHKYIIQGASADVLSIDASDFSNTVSSSWLANGSVGAEVAKDSQGHTFVSAAGTSDGTAYFKNTTLNVRGTINFYVHAQVNGTATVFGAYNEPDGVVISYTTTTASNRYSPNSMTLFSNTAGWSLTKMATCPTGITNNRQAVACWSAPTMKAGILYEIKGTLTADVGDPIPSDYFPRITFDNKQFFREIDNSIKYGTYNGGGTHQGVGGTVLIFNVA